MLCQRGTYVRIFMNESEINSRVHLYTYIIYIYICDTSQMDNSYICLTQGNLPTTLDFSFN